MAIKMVCVGVMSANIHNKEADMEWEIGGSKEWGWGYNPQIVVRHPLM